MSQSAPAMEDSTALRLRVIETGCAINRAGINVNKSGNVSARCTRGTHAGAVLTPTALPFESLAAEDIVVLRLADGHCSGRREPSSEWRFHRDIYVARPEFGAIVHTHSRAATALACHGLGLPAFHYMIASAGGNDIRCAPYATFGTQELSDHAVAALAGRKACLLAQHGVIACETTLERALALAIEVEHLARIYITARQFGEPQRLSSEEMARVLSKFERYGRAD